MCTWIVENAKMAGSGKGAQGWFRVSEANVSYDHPVHAPYTHAVLLDFVNPSLGPGARVALEIDVASARELIRTLEATIELSERIEGGQLVSTG